MKCPMWSMADIRIKERQELMNTRNCILAVWDQLTRKGAWRNIFVTHNAFGIFSRYSHVSRSTARLNSVMRNITPEELAALGLPPDYEKEFRRRKQRLFERNRTFLNEYH